MIIMKYRKSSLKYIQSLDEIYEMLIENYKNPETRFHPSAGDFSFLVNFEEELEVFKNKAFEWRTVDNTLVGIDWTDYRGTYYIITRQTNDEIYSIILNDIESRHSESEEIWVWNCETNMARCSELQRRNYMTNGWYMFYGHKSLVDFVPTVNMPNGYAVRELTDTDIPAKVKLMGVSMGEACNRTIEKYRNMQKSIVYERMTDLVVVDSNNTLVSFCNG